jgi:hypothetical protein
VARQDALGKCLRRDGAPVANKPDTNKPDAKIPGHAVGMSPYFGRGPRVSPDRSWLFLASSRFVPYAFTAP